MPRRATNLLRWSPEEQRYVLSIGGHAQTAAVVPGGHAWWEWLDSIRSFAFQSRSGGHCTVRKERLQRGDVYWYGYRSVHGRTRKHYIGRTADLSLERLESISARFMAEKHEPTRPVVAPGQAQPDPDGGVARSSAPLLETKLHRPRLAAQLVERARLLELLDAGCAHKLILLHAPAGFGKTTLVSQWLDEKAKGKRQKVKDADDSEALLPFQTAWLSLDSSDNDPVRFWSYVIAACQKVHPQIGQAALRQLSLTPQLPFPQSPLETALTLLLNDLSGTAPEGLLILEDYHQITQARIHDTLVFFIEHLPATLRVVILTRSIPPLPLARWRASGALLELQTAQLRFSDEETASFLQQHVPGPLSDEAIRLLATHLEGWAAGLRLLALNVQSQAAGQAVERYLAQLRHRSIQDYFMSEVLYAQPEQLQSFLLRTSILTRLTADLCDAVTGQQDSAIWLEQAARSGFFLESLDSIGQWYRYHTLFAEAMRSEAQRRLGTDVLRDLSLRASCWYEAHAMPVEAIEAALYAHAPERAADLIEGLNATLPFSEHHTMLRWLGQLPEPLVQTRLLLSLRYAQAQLFVDAGALSPAIIVRIDQLLECAEAGWREQDDPLYLGELYALRALFYLHQGLTAPAAASARQALQLLPPDADRSSEWPNWHSTCLVALGAEATSAGNFAQARPLLLEAYTRSLSSADRIFPLIIRLMLGEVHTGLGNLHQAAAYYRQLLAETKTSLHLGEAIIRTMATIALAEIAYQWNDLDTAEQLTCTAFEHDYYYWADMLRGEIEMATILLLHTRGATDAAQQRLNALLVRLHTFSAPATRELMPNLLGRQAHFQISEGDLAAAEHTLDARAGYADAMYPLHHEVQQILSARLLLARGEVEAALPMLDQLLGLVQERQHINRALEIRLLIALAYAARKQHHKAQQQLYAALAQARTGGFVRLFLNEGQPLAALLRSLLPSIAEKPLRAYAQAILRAYAAPLHTHSAGDPLPEPLSAQERRVLVLLAAGRSNPQIAQELIVSINTVKGHVRNLYRKLDVNGRIQASEAARRLGLI